MSCTISRHGFSFIFIIFFFFYTVSAQVESPPDPQMYAQPPKFNPSLAILMVIIVSAFFVMGFFSVYIRQCAERRYYRRGNFDPLASPLGGGGRWSRRRREGLETEVINSFPTFLYSTVKGHKIGKDILECAVCLNEFEDDETLRLIPKCSHVFHPECIDAWLSSHITCPVCRANLVPKPGDLAFDSSSLFEPNNNMVEPDRLPRSNTIYDDMHNDVLIQVCDDDHDQHREVIRNQQSPEVILPNTTPNRNRPPRSWSTGWRFGRLFLRSRSTGHLLVQPGENVDRFTLRLPEDLRNQLLNTQLNRAKSCVAFPRASSSKKGYRSRSGSTWLSKNFFYHERLDRPGFPPTLPRTGSVRSSKEVSGSDDMNATPPKNFLRTVKSPFDQLLLLGIVDKSNSKNDIGERSSDRLRGNNDVSSSNSQV